MPNTIPTIEGEYESCYVLTPEQFDALGILIRKLDRVCQKIFVTTLTPYCKLRSNKVSPALLQSCSEVEDRCGRLPTMWPALLQSCSLNLDIFYYNYVVMLPHFYRAAAHTFLSNHYPCYNIPALLQSCSREGKAMQGIQRGHPHFYRAAAGSYHNPRREEVVNGPHFYRAAAQALRRGPYTWRRLRSSRTSIELQPVLG